jgi:WD40 repeat-containing protein SMU1
MMTQAHDKEVVGLTVHPHLNLVATYATDGEVRLWKP